MINFHFRFLFIVKQDIIIYLSYLDTPQIYFEVIYNLFLTFAPR